MIKKDSPHCTTLREFLFWVSMFQELIEGVFFLKESELETTAVRMKIELFFTQGSGKYMPSFLLSRYEVTHVVQSLSQSNCL